MSNPFDRNPFGLPPPWNPGYALPQNVDDEGLERRAYTTSWSARGTYDNPKVGDGGYELPGYVEGEQYGQGAHVTSWAPRGSYAGPPVPHWLDRQAAKVIGRKALPGGATQLKIKSLAGIEHSKTGATPFASYGTKSASALIETVKMMPPDMREGQLRKALDRIDPKLYSRGEQLATAESKAGVPADRALERGLALAMAHGIAAEIVDLGKGKVPPKRSSQLGATLAMMGATEIVPGHWERARAGVACSSPLPAGVAPRPGYCWIPATTREAVAQTSTEGSTQSRIAATMAAVAPSDQKFLSVGPFLIPTNVGAYRDQRTLSAEKKAYVDGNLAIAAKAGGVSVAEMKTGKYPFVRFKANGEDWGLFYQETSTGTMVAYHKVAPSMIGNVFSDIGGAIKDSVAWVGGAIASVFKKIWAAIKWVVVKVVDFVKDAAVWVMDKACDLFSSPIGQIAGAAAGAAIGGPTGAQAGAMGAQVAAQACSTPVDAGAQTSDAQGTNLMPVLLIGGAGIAAVLLLSRKKK